MLQVIRETDDDLPRVLTLLAAAIDVKTSDEERDAITRALKTMAST